MGFYAGVPDSLLAPFCAQLAKLNEGAAFTHEAGHATSSTSDVDVGQSAPVVRHVVAANEGAAVGLALGYHLATGGLPLVYLQNSGLGNAVNPLLSAAHPHVYGCPMLLLVGWRGAPGTKDEPQHAVQGRQTLALLEALEVPVFTLPADDAGARDALARAAAAARQSGGPVALLVPPKTFAGGKAAVVLAGSDGAAPPAEVEACPTRTEALAALLDVVRPGDAVVATTGYTSRELYELREARVHACTCICLCMHVLRCEGVHGVKVGMRLHGALLHTAHGAPQPRMSVCSSRLPPLAGLQPTPAATCACSPRPPPHATPRRAARRMTQTSSRSAAWATPSPSRRPATWGCSLRHIGLQPPPYRFAASST